IKHPRAGADEETAEPAIAGVLDEPGSHAQVRQLMAGDHFPREPGDGPHLVAGRTGQTLDAAVVQPPVLEPIRPEMRAEPSSRDVRRHWLGRIERVSLGKAAVPVKRGG